MNEDEMRGQEPPNMAQPGDPHDAPPSAEPAPTAIEADRPVPARTPYALAGKLKSRALVSVGVAALVVGGSVLGAQALSSSGASRGSNLSSVLTASHGDAATAGATITVTGNGQVEGTPDAATFSVGVSTTASSAVNALDRNNAQVAGLESSLETDGVLVKDIQTSWLNLSANTNSAGDVTGFTADHELSVTMQNLSNLGMALDDAVHATGNGVTLDGISFSISNQSALLASARAQAMLSANTEASQVAAGAGLSLGPIVKVTDQENAGQQVFFAPVAAAGTGASSVPVQPGQQQISVGVTVVYQLVASS
jgi:uncharacterized protein YggE